MRLLFFNTLLNFLRKKISHNYQPKIVTRFIKDKKCMDIANNRLTPKAFISAKSKGEISVVCIDLELTQSNCDKLIFDIGDLIYVNISEKAKARGDMKVSEIKNITYSDNGFEERNIFLEHSPTDNIPNHYNIKPDLLDLRFADHCAHNLSRISKLVIR